MTSLTPTQTTIPTLHALSSSMALRVLWALEELLSTQNIDFKLKTYSRRAPTTSADLKSVFPLGKSPVITLEPSDTTSQNPSSILEETHQIVPNTLTETRLILAFISDNYSHGIWDPITETDRNRDTFFQEFANATVLAKVDFALIFEVPCQFLPFPFKQITSLLVRPMVNHFLGDLKDVFTLMEGALSEEKPWFAGAKIGLADFNMSFPMDIARQRGYFKSGDYPKLERWHDCVMERPAYKRAVERLGVYDLVNFG